MEALFYVSRVSLCLRARCFGGTGNGGFAHVHRFTFRRSVARKIFIRQRYIESNSELHNEVIYRIFTIFPRIVRNAKKTAGRATRLFPPNNFYIISIVRRLCANGLQACAKRRKKTARCRESCLPAVGALSGETVLHGSSR